MEDPLNIHTIDVTSFNVINTAACFSNAEMSSSDGVTLLEVLIPWRGSGNFVSWVYKSYKTAMQIWAKVFFKLWNKRRRERKL